MITSLPHLHTGFCVLYQNAPVVGNQLQRYPEITDSSQGISTPV